MRRPTRCDATTRRARCGRSTLVYGGLLGALVTALVTALVLRVPLKVDVIRDRGSLARAIDEDRVENVYRLQVMNTAEQRHVFTIGAAGLDGLVVDSAPSFEVGPATSVQIPLRLRAPQAAVAPGSHRIVLEVRSQDEPGLVVHEKSVFFGLRD